MRKPVYNSSLLDLLTMTRQTWTTNDQKEWLDARKTAFLEAKQKELTSKEFFPQVVQEFREKWPVPPVTENEINFAGSVELATKVKRDKYDKACADYCKRNDITKLRHSACESGFTTVHVPWSPIRGLVVCLRSPQSQECFRHGKRIMH